MVTEAKRLLASGELHPFGPPTLAPETARKIETIDGQVVMFIAASWDGISKNVVVYSPKA
jgi:hypothetical protein